MLKKTFKDNGVDYSLHVREDGLKMSYIPIKGLPDKMTLDTTNHVDLIKYKRLLTVSYNPTDEDVTSEITAVYTSGLQFITVFDIKSKADVTFLAEPSTILDDPWIVDEQGDITYYQLSDLTFKEV